MITLQNMEVIDEPKLSLLFNPTNHMLSEAKRTQAQASAAYCHKQRKAPLKLTHVELKQAPVYSKSVLLVTVYPRD